MHLKVIVSGIVILLVLSACDASLPEPTGTQPVAVKAPPGIAASYAGLDIPIDAVEAEIAAARTPACAEAHRSPGGGSVEKLLPCYREVAETQAIEHIVIDKVSDIEQAMKALDENYIEQRDAALTSAYYRRLIGQTEVTDAEIDLAIASEEPAAETSRQFTLYNIYRRHRDPANPGETVSFLNQLRVRINAGETFGSIAREYSDSETRLNDGLIGQLPANKLPQRLREATADLENGEISEPIMVRGGAVLLKIENSSSAIGPNPKAIREAMRRKLTEARVREAIETRNAGQMIPVDAVLLTTEQLFSQLDGEESDRVIFDLGGQKISVAEFRKMTGLENSGKVADLPQERLDQLKELYLRLKQQRLLIMSLLASEDSDEIELREQLEQPLQKERLARLVDKQIQEDMWRSVDENPATLERFFRDNSHHYQTPLRFKLQILNLPFDQDPTAQIANLEALRNQAPTGNDSLKLVAERMGGSIEDLGWRELSELEDIPKKAKSYLLQTPAGGYSVPYQQDDALHMIWVEAQQSPEKMTYVDVADRVREDYYERFERRLYQEAVKQRLIESNFVFYADNVREVLSPPHGDDTKTAESP